MRPGRFSPQVLAVAAVLAITAVAFPLATSAGAGNGDGDGSGAGGSGDGDLVAQGRDLYITGCASCHGSEGQGREPQDGGAGGPALTESGEAAAYFYLSTGRMPAASSDAEPTRKEPAYSPEDIDALVAYVASLGDGPALPEIDLTGADLAEGGSLYRANCQACHSASGSGGALSYGRAAPALGDATPEQIGAAVRVGPGQMPVFGPDTINDRELNDLVRYVRYLDSPEDPGGLPIGRTGPIPEGFVAWLVGMVTLVGFVVWIGTRAPLRRSTTALATAAATGGSATADTEPPAPSESDSAPTAAATDPPARSKSEPEATAATEASAAATEPPASSESESEPEATAAEATEASTPTPSEAEPAPTESEVKAIAGTEATAAVTEPPAPSESEPEPEATAASEPTETAAAATAAAPAPDAPEEEDQP